MPYSAVVSANCHQTAKNFVWNIKNEISLFYSRNTQRVPVGDYLGMTFIKRERIALLESKFHF